MATRKIYGTQYDDTINVFPTTFSVVTNTTKAKKAALEIYDVSDFNTAVFAGDGKDRVTIVGTSNDAVDGGAGDDVIYGGFGNDLLSGGGGKDTIYGGSGDDIIGAVRPGKAAGVVTDYVIDLNSDQIGDLLVGDGVDPTLVPAGYVALPPATPGNDVIVGGNGKDILWGDNWPYTDADTPFGGDDTLFGGNGDDSLYGQGGNDRLKGENGNDNIDGGTGNDIIDGGTGADILKGGADADVFVYNSALDSTTMSIDTIVDFSRASDDKIDLRPLLGATDLGWGGYAAKAYGTWLQASGANTLILIDTSGDALADMAIQLNGTFALRNADFLGVKNTAPSLQPIPGLVYNDTAGDDTFADASGTLVGLDSDANDVVSYKLAGSTASVEAGFDVQKTSTYGTLYMNTSSGDYKLVANDGTIEALKTTQMVSFSVTAYDGLAESTPQSISITINGVNDSPRGVPTMDLADGRGNTSYTFSTSDLLQGFSDIEGDALSVANLTADHGTIQSNGIDSWTLLPAADYNGLVTLNYAVTDGFGGITQASQSIELEPAVFEFKVNTFTLSDQYAPSITGLKDGGWITTWMSANQDGSGWGIYLQRFADDGSLQGGEIRVNDTTENNQYFAACTALSDGGWVTTWISVNQDGSGEGIYQQRFDAYGSAIGGEMQVNTTAASDQTTPAIAALADGGWVTTWASYDLAASSWEIYQQRYDHTGTAIDGEVRVNTTTTDNQLHPAIAALADGGWVTTWMSPDGSDNGIYQQRYNADGSANGCEMLANTNTTYEQASPDIMGLSDGGWITTWTSWAQDLSSWGNYQQRFDSSSKAIGDEVLVNTTVFSSQVNPSVTAMSDGGWVTTWASYEQDGSEFGVIQQRFDAAGAKVGDEIQVNTYTASWQFYTAIAALNDGGWVTTWTSISQDGSGWGIYQQRYDASGNRVAMPLAGNDAANSLVWTGSGPVTLNGAGGDDVLTGGADNDILIGGSGNDILTGLDGSDRFVFLASDGPGVDSIRDFSPALPAASGDILDLSDLLIGFIPGTSNLSDFVQSHEDAGNTTISVDRDGSGTDYTPANVMTLVGMTGMDLNTLLAQGNLVVA